MKTISLFKVFMARSVRKELNKVLYSGFIGQGQKVNEFEEALCKLWHTDNLLTVNSGTSALTLAYHLIGLGRGSEVISTPITCFATHTPLLNLNCNIKWADVDPLTGLIDPEDVARKITDKTKAIICVDWGGTPCDYDKLKSFGIPVIHDAAHSALTMYNDKYIAESGGDFVCYSLQAIKALTAGDGGVLKVPEKYYKRAKLLRWYGFDRENSQSFRCSQDVKEAGFKYHMNDINATIGLCNLKDLKINISLSKRNALYYDGNINNDKIKLIPYDKNSSYWLYTLHTKDRNGLIKYLKENGIDSSPVHNRNDDYTVTRQFKNNRLHGVNSFDKTHLCIPVGFYLTMKDLKHITRTINRW